MTIDLQPRWTRKPIRLDRGIYANPASICSVTIAVRDRLPVFAEPRVAGVAVEVLRTHAERTSVRVYAYCVMPDHVHLVASPSTSCDLVSFVAEVKNLTQRAAWRHGVQGGFWQRRFWDHFVRGDEDLHAVIEYVWNNPVRAGLVADADDYAYSGALVAGYERQAGDKPLHYE